MKRSEMFRKISSYLHSRNGHKDDYWCDYCDQTAEDILTLVEHEQMLPPLCEKPIDFPYYNGKPLGPTSKIVNEWSPEDEKK